jgi:glycosyltransferase involved in cell wall biosynthesis
VLKGRDAGVARWLLLRSLATQRHLADARRRGADGAHVTTHAVALLTSPRSPLPVSLSVDTTLWPWQLLLRGLPDGTSPAADMALPLALERRALTSAALVQAWTRTVADEVRRVAPAATVVAHHPGLDVDLFRPGPAGAGPLRVLFVGGRFTQKGGPDLIEILRPRLGSDVVLDVVTTESVPTSPGVQVRRLAPRSPELVRAFREADVFCLPSRADAVPWVVLEAMASGTPVVAFDVGSVREMVGGAGLVVPRDDLRSLRGALDALLDDPAARSRAGSVARAEAEARYDARVQVPALLTLVAEATLGRHDSPDDAGAARPAPARNGSTR